MRPLPSLPKKKRHDSLRVVCRLLGQTLREECWLARNLLATSANLETKKVLGAPCVTRAHRDHNHEELNKSFSRRYSERVAHSRHLRSGGMIEAGTVALHHLVWGVFLCD